MSTQQEQHGIRAARGADSIGHSGGDPPAERWCQPLAAVSTASARARAGTAGEPQRLGGGRRRRVAFEHNRHSPLRPPENSCEVEHHGCRGEHEREEVDGSAKSGNPREPPCARVLEERERQAEHAAWRRGIGRALRRHLRRVLLCLALERLGAAREREEERHEWDAEHARGESEGGGPTVGAIGA
eukprot:scaffold147934_cov32-Tisochrysis_lutea.AAC.1